MAVASVSLEEEGVGLRDVRDPAGTAAIERTIDEHPNRAGTGDAPWDVVVELKDMRIPLPRGRIDGHGLGAGHAVDG